MGSQSVQLIDSDRNRAEIDSINPALVVMQSDHENIHRGILFSGSRIAEAVADDGTIEILVTVTNATHLRVRAATTGVALLFVFDGNTDTNDGTAVPSLNRNRSSAITPTTVLTHTPTLTADGTQIAERLVPAAGISVAEEFILDAGLYLLRLKNISAAAADMSVEVDFYEPGLG